jgi:transcription factor C subunit 3
MSGSSVVPDYYFINVSLPASRASSRAVSLKWSDETQYDLETLPYGELEDDDYGDVIYIEDGAERTGEDGEPSPKRRRGVQKAAAGQPKRTKGGRPPKLKLAAIKTMREHTSYPKTADDLLRQDDNDDLDWSSENVRLAAFIVVTTLLGGVDKVVDWGLMLRLMPNQT